MQFCLIFNPNSLAQGQTRQEGVDISQPSGRMKRQATISVGGDTGRWFYTDNQKAQLNVPETYRTTRIVVIMMAMPAAIIQPGTVFFSGRGSSWGSCCRRSAIWRRWS